MPGYEGDSDDDDGTYMFGTIAVSVKQGDIMTEDADCIVNSSNEELDLNRGKKVNETAVFNKRNEYQIDSWIYCINLG